MFRLIGIITACVLVSGCGDPTPPAAPQSSNLNEIAREYLLLELGMGLHDANHVDAYFGPEDIKSKASELKLSLEQIDARADALTQSLRSWPAHGIDEEARITGLVQRLKALRTRVALNQGKTLPFDDEAVALFGVSPPDHDAVHFAAILRNVDELLPGDEPLSVRVNLFQEKFVIADDKLSGVFDAAIAECRRRTLAHIKLPDNESFRVEYVNDKPWSGYNWYQGNAQSLIQINTDLPIYIGRAVDLGCHEGYPGHHTFNLLLEKNLVQEKGWLEYTLYPLFSPESLIAEGSGNYGIELAFPGEERVTFEKQVLFPLAGLDPSSADRYYELQSLLADLDYADNEAARDYLNGNTGRADAEQWLVDYALNSPQRARQRVKFIDTYRSYVINYNLGQDMVRDYVERNAADASERWSRFAQLLSTPMLPEDLLP
jgi:hypothetical protein